MKQRVLIFVVVFLLKGGLAMAQTAPDTLAAADTAKHKAVKAVLNGPHVKALQGKLGLAGASQKAGQLQSAATAKLNDATSALAKSLKQAKKPAVTLELNLENALRYKPQTIGPVPVAGQSLVNNFYVQGTLHAFGIPLNINYSNDHNGIAAAGSQLNNLFKFDFNPAQFKQLFTSDMQQYYDVRKNAFAGMDIGSYTRKILTEQVRSQQAALAGKAGGGILGKYLEDPAKVSELLGMDEAQIKQKLSAVAQAEAKKELPANALTNINTANPTGTLSAVSKTAEEKVKQQLTAQAPLNANLAQYINNPASLATLKNLDEAQIAQKLTTVGAAGKLSDKDREAIKSLDTQVPSFPHISGFILHEIDAKDQADKAQIQTVAQQLYQSSHTADQTKANALTALRGKATENKTIDSIARVITGIKANLQKQGVDVNKMLQIQKYLDQGKGTLPATELASAFTGRKPGNALQNLFTNVQALKLGSFGNQVPGGIQAQDRFIDGAHITVKAGHIPVTAGYGSINDVTSAKDAGYQSSVYSAPQNITYLSASMNQGTFGKVKLAVVSSFSGTGNNNNYASPSGSSNNVALTLSKNMNMGKLGNVDFDVSKSTTLYQNKYQVGIDAPVLAAKAGLTNTGSDLFEAIGFGITHHLEVKEANLSDNIYFNYAGLGYQNPANNGYGGARMKLGGNLKKTFYKNKLVLNLRTDIRNTPISYTSNDKWKNYQVQLNGRYNVSKKFNVSLKYSTNGTDKQVDNTVTPVYAFHSLQADGNLTYKIGKNYSVSHFSIGKQDYSNTYVAQGGGSLVMMNYTQSIVMHRNTLTTNIFYNRELSSYSIIGNMLNADASYQYILFEKVNLSSGLTYLDNTGASRQAGIKQGIRLLGGKSISVDSYIDIRKNMITPLYPELYPSCMGELAIKYHFNY